MLLMLLALVAGSPSGAWSVTVDRDPITDRAQAVAAAVGEDGALKVQCEGNDPTSPMIAWATVGFFGDGSSGADRPLIYRIDEAPPVTREWTYLDDVAVLREDNDSLLRAIRSAKRITLRGTTYRGGTITSVLNVEGAGEAIDRAYAACGLTSPK